MGPMGAPGTRAGSMSLRLFTPHPSPRWRDRPWWRGEDFGVQQQRSTGKPQKPTLTVLTPGTLFTKRGGDSPVKVSPGPSQLRLRVGRPTAGVCSEDPRQRLGNGEAGGGVTRKPGGVQVSRLGEVPRGLRVASELGATWPARRGASARTPVPSYLKSGF